MSVATSKQHKILLKDEIKSIWLYCKMLEAAVDATVDLCTCLINWCFFVRQPNEFNIITLRYFNPIGAHESGDIGEDPIKKNFNIVPFLGAVAMGHAEKFPVFGDDYATPDGTCTCWVSSNIFIDRLRSTVMHNLFYRHERLHPRDGLSWRTPSGAEKIRKCPRWLWSELKKTLKFLIHCKPKWWTEQGKQISYSLQTF
jgi:hypothetical protein